jgi:hypothetical protein
MKQDIAEEISEIEAKKAWLENQIQVHNEIALLERQIEEIREEMQDSEVMLQALKEEVDDYASQKAFYVAKTCSTLADKASQLLPSGSIYIDIGEGDVVKIGWIREDGVMVPYPGLSGGQKVAFDMAVSVALLGVDKNKILVVEAAELDSEHLLNLLTHIQKEIPEQTQIIVNTCHEVEAPQGWIVNRL